MRSDICPSFLIGSAKKPWSPRASLKSPKPLYLQTVVWMERVKRGEAADSVEKLWSTTLRQET
ncbi:hypothetical protein RRU01S_37_00290 [Agrobacterium rubi TR3 = NBRC 13261]|uniref:Uncharacterized protein n=1 Tax=Agrobacterium rubi TR3 = NBRC 13261 TaxID=1368415 RepID=A0A081D3A0_9HYPH|nr:hypothetical protein RRU01S_37_00290 [Agrobacterium rubi TR3 = NBRC 13261]